jgi:hypothetical protein
MHVIQISPHCIFSVCRVDTDVVFVLDSSGSIGFDNYQLVKHYVNNYTEHLLSPSFSSRIGVISFSDTATVDIELSFGEQKLAQKIGDLSFISGGTNTPEGLCLLLSMPWRNGTSVLRDVVVLTDGQSNKVSTTCSEGTVTTVAPLVHNMQPRVTVFAVGVGAEVNHTELTTIATSPELVDELDSFNSQLLLQNQRSRTYFICFKGMLTVIQHAHILHIGSMLRILKSKWMHTSGSPYSHMYSRGKLP